MKSRTPFYSRVMRWLWAGFAGLVIAAAVLLSVVRMMLPLVQDYRHEVAQYLGHELGREVRIAAIGMEWRGLYPMLKLSNVDLLHDSERDAGQVWLHMDALRISIDPFSLSFPGEYNLRAIQVVGTQLAVARRPGGAYLLNGIPVVKGGENREAQGELLGWLLSRSRLGVMDSMVSFVDEGRGRSVTLEHSSFELYSRNGSHQINGHFSAEGGKGESIAFVLDLAGDLRRPDELSMEFYLEGKSSLRPWQGLGISRLKEMQGMLSVRLWGGADQNGLQRLEGDIELQDLFWPGIDSKHNQVQPLALDVERVAGRFFWRSLPQAGWVLDVEHYQMGLQGSEGTAETPGFTVVKTTDAENDVPVWYGQFASLQLQDLNRLVQSLVPLRQEALFAMTTLQPRGRLHDTRFRYYGGDWDLDHLYVKASVSQLQVSSWNRLPSLFGINGDLEMNGRQGHVQLSNNDPVYADFHGVFLHPIEIDSLGVRMEWQAHDSGWSLVAEEMQAVNEDLTANGRMEMRFNQGMNSPFLDMQVDFKHGDVASAYRYLPRNKLSPKLLEWLEHALARGRIGAGSMLFSGEMADFPFDHNEGVFEVRFNVEEMLLAYMEGWPQAYNMQADVLFSGRSLAVEIAEARIFDLEVLPGLVEIKDLSKQAMVELDLKTRGSLQDVIRYLRESPAGAGYAPFLSGVEGDGSTAFDLQLKLPINDTDKRVLSGQLTFQDNGLRLPQWSTEFEKLAGVLHFDFSADQHRFKAEDISALFQGNDANINVYTLSGPEQGVPAGKEQTRVDIHTLLNVSSLLDQHAPVLKDVMQGASPGLASLRITAPGDKRDNDVVLHLESRLEGVDLNLPGQFLHKKGQRHNLMLELTLTESEALPVYMDYDGRIKASLLLDRDAANKSLKLLKGGVALGGTSPAMPASSQIELVGRLERLDVNQWLAWYEAVIAGKKKGAGAGDAGLPLQQVRSADLSLGVLSLGQYAFHNAAIRALRQEGYWEVEARSDELQGNVRVPLQPGGDEPLVMDLVRVNLQDPEHPAERGARQTSNPEHWPLLKVFSKQFVYNGIDYGELNLTTRRLDRGLRVEQLNIASAMLKAAASGSWINTDNGQVSDFSIQLTTSDLGNLLRQWKYHGAIEKGEADAKLQVKWGGSPIDFNLEHIEGDIALTIQKGRLLDVEPSGGRVFGLLSIQALPRRLALDFSDLYKKGLSFDRIEGKFSVVDGNAYTNDLFLEGPAGQIDVSGRIGLVERDYDQDVYVTPRISSTIPVVGGLAGGPGVGLGLLLAEHLLKGKLDKLSRIHYEVKGSWDKPEVVKIKDN